MAKPAIAVVGAGSAGCSMAIALYQAGYPIASVTSRSIESAQHCASMVDCDAAGIDPAAATLGADIVLIATPDGVIESSCRQIASAGGFTKGQLVVHLSGALTSEALATACDAGTEALSLHPVQTMVDPVQSAKLLKDAWFCLEGDEQAIARGRSLVNDISGKCTVIDKDKKALYHAALCVSSNYLIALEAIAVEMLNKAGIGKEDALSLLMPLIRGSVDNLAHCGLPEALTGPISRGDSGTIEKHMRALQNSPPSQRQSYQLLGQEALRVAQAKGNMAEGSVPLIQQSLGFGTD